MSNEFDSYAGNYDEVLAQALGTRRDIDRFARYKVEFLVHRLRSASTGRVLDFGCGVGRGLPFLAAAFPEAELWGFDPSEQSAAEAVERAERARVTSSWSQVPLRHFDLIVAANVFHHIAETERVAALEQCKSALADEGHLFVFEHNPHNPVTRRVFERCPFDVDAAMIRRERMMEDGVAAGMRVVRAPYTLFIPFRVRFVARIERALTWLPLGAQYCVEFAR